MKIRTPDGIVLKRVQGVLLLVSCDAPGLRKLLGFAGGKAKDHFCTKCFCKLSEINEYRCDHERRTADMHRWCGKIWRDGYEDAKKAEAAWQEYGYRYTPFNELEYFDSIRFGIIDPMHSLLEGNCKNLILALYEAKVLRDANYEFIQKRMDLVKSPREIGQIPHRIASNMARFKADQVK